MSVTIDNKNMVLLKILFKEDLYKLYAELSIKAKTAACTPK